MAAKNTGKRNTTGSRKKTTQNTNQKRTTGRQSGQKGRKPENGSSDWLTRVLLIGGAVVIVILLLQYFKEGKGEEKPSVTPTAVVSPEPTKEPSATEAPSGEEQPTPTPEPTKQAEATPVTVTPEPTKEPEPAVTAEKAMQIIEDEVDTKLYSIALLNDHLVLDDGEEYFMFCISDEAGEMEPLLLVNKESGIIRCYSFEGELSDFSGFPLDNVEQAEPSATEISKDAALALLKGLSKETLGLAKDVSEYDEITYDDWTTMANGVSCYGINVFETVNDKLRFRGAYYVAVDGSKIYRLDSETNEFIELR